MKILNIFEWCFSLVFPLFQRRSRLCQKSLQFHSFRFAERVANLFGAFQRFVVFFSALHFEIVLFHFRPLPMTLPLLLGVFSAMCSSFQRRHSSLGSMTREHCLNASLFPSFGSKY